MPKSRDNKRRKQRARKRMAKYVAKLRAEQNAVWAECLGAQQEYYDTLTQQHERMLLAINGVPAEYLR